MAVVPCEFDDLVRLGTHAHQIIHLHTTTQSTHLNCMIVLMDYMTFNETMSHDVYTVGVYNLRKDAI